MKPETVHALALIGLRALAEYDPIEFRRSTDLSKGHLDNRIEGLLGEVHNEGDLYDLRRQLDQLRSVERESENQVASAFLFRQISVSCLQRAQALAIAYQSTAGPFAHGGSQGVQENASVSVDRRFSKHEENLRLGVMRLLRDLPEYAATFNFRWRHREIDCVLQPVEDGSPAILIEFKQTMRSKQRLRDAFRQLHEAGAGWGKSTLFGIITASPNEELFDIWTELVPPKLRQRTFLLTYDVERNEFSHQSANTLLYAVRQSSVEQV